MAWVKWLWTCSTVSPSYTCNSTPSQMKMECSNTPSGLVWSYTIPLSHPPPGTGQQPSNYRVTVNTCPRIVTGRWSIKSLAFCSVGGKGVYIVSFLLSAPTDLINRHPTHLLEQCDI